MEYQLVTKKKKNRKQRQKRNIPIDSINNNAPVQNEDNKSIFTQAADADDKRLGPIRRSKCGRNYTAIFGMLMARDIEIIELPNEPFELVTKAQLEEFMDLLRYDKAVISEYSRQVIYDLQLEPEERYHVDNLLTYAKQHGQYNKEHENDKLIEYMKHPYVSVGHERKDGSSLSYVGHLCTLVAPYIKTCYKDNKCTYSVTKNNFIRQKGYHCMTCYPNIKGHSICLTCADICHKNHNLIPLPKDMKELQNDKKSHMFCDCGANLPGQKQCQCL